MKAILLSICMATSAQAFPGWQGCAVIPNDFHPSWGCAGREALWNLVRNPFIVNLVPRADVIPNVPDWNPKGGFWFLAHKDHLPFESYRPSSAGKFPYIEEYLGWKPSGSFGGALRRAYSSGY